MIKAFDIKSNEVNVFHNCRVSSTDSSAGISAAKISKNTKIAKKPVLPTTENPPNAIIKPKPFSNATLSKRKYS
jgi:hypothetical protein